MECSEKGLARDNQNRCNLRYFDANRNWRTEYRPAGPIASERLSDRVFLKNTIDLCAANETRASNESPGFVRFQA